MKKALKGILKVVVTFVRCFAGMIFGVTGITAWLVVAIAALIVGVVLAISDLLVDEDSVYELFKTVCRKILRVLCVDEEKIEAVLS